MTVSRSNGASVGDSFTGLPRSRLLRIGGSPADETVWNASGPGEIAGQVASEDVNGLAAFLQATGRKY